MRRRRVQAKRRAKGRQRLGKLRWLWRQGGQAKAVARDGICAEMKYGDEIVGLPNSVLRDMRRSHAAVTSIKVAGASTTAKLALGGNAYSEFDPAVLQVNPPLAALLGKIWDQPRSRSSFIRSWRQAEEEVAQTPAASRWSAIRGPVGAAWAHLLRVQGAWPRPFTVHIMDSEINILQVPPIQVMLIMKAHARRYYDRAMVSRLSIYNDWDADAVNAAYAEGVEWETIRGLLREASGDLAAKDKNALLMTVSGGFWPEQRRWRHGLKDDSECTACGAEVADDIHRLHGCDAMNYQQNQWRAEGRVGRFDYTTYDLGLALVVCMGLPPAVIRWEPIEFTLREGHVGMGTCRGDDNEVYGDGSGYNQSQVKHRVATWAIARRTGAKADGEDVYERLRGVVDGWFSTVPRGELQAFVEFLRHAGPGEEYVGDCSYVIEGARNGAPERLAMSRNINADLWKEVRRMIRDRGTCQQCTRRVHTARGQRRYKTATNQFNGGMETRSLTNMPKRWRAASRRPMCAAALSQKRSATIVWL